MKSQKGVTLVALVITIVVLLILAGVTLTMVISPDNVVTKAGEAKNKTAAAVTNEAIGVNTALNLLTQYAPAE